MKINIDRTWFSSVISVASIVANKNNMKDSDLKLIFFNIKNKKFNIISTNYATTFKTEVDISESPDDIVSGDGEDSFCVEASKIKEFVNIIKDKEIYLTSESQDKDIYLVSSDTEILIKRREIPLDFTSSTVSFADHVSFNINKDELFDCIFNASLCIYTDNKDSLQNKMSGISNILIKKISDEKYKNSLIFCGADNKRMSFCNPKISEDIKDFTALVPKTISEFLSAISVLPGIKEQVPIKVDSNKILFEFTSDLANYLISSNLGEGNFPKIEKFIPCEENYPLIISVSAEKLLKALKIAEISSSDLKTNICKIKINSEYISISSEGSAFKDSSKIKYEIIKSSEPSINIDISFIIKFILDGIKRINNDKFIISISDYKSPIIIRINEYSKYIAMPNFMSEPIKQAEPIKQVEPVKSEEIDNKQEDIEITY